MKRSSLGCFIRGVLLVIGIVLFILTIIGLITQNEIRIGKEDMYSFEFYGGLLLGDIVLLLISLWLGGGDEDFIQF